MTQGYTYNKAWRERHPDRRHRWKTDYRARTGSGVGPRLGEQWTSDEDRVVLAHAIPDRDLAEQLGRSVQAIAVRRCRLRKSPISVSSSAPDGGTEPTATCERDGHESGLAAGGEACRRARRAPTERPCR